MLYKKLRVPHDQKISLKDYPTDDTLDFDDKSAAQEKLEADIAEMAKLQDILYASEIFSVLIILQAQDAAGKDGAIKHVLTGLNPQGVHVHGFKVPTPEELKHDYLWRYLRLLPEKGQIGIFNRSYYEEVVTLRVHPELLEKEKIDPEETSNIWKQRYEDINNVERYLTNNNVVILKFFLHVSKDTQKERFLDRINTPEKTWKLSSADIKERGFWDDYIAAFEKTLSHTSTSYAPWFVIPADHKWVTRVAIGDILRATLEDLKLSYPTISKEQKEDIAQAKEILTEE